MDQTTVEKIIDLTLNEVLASDGAIRLDPHSVYYPKKRKRIKLGIKRDVLKILQQEGYRVDEYKDEIDKIIERG